jgi:general secretion pathway protein A
MYYSHFGFQEEPFGVTPDPRFFFCSRQHREAVATLFLATSQRRGLALLVGPAGLGKTSVLFTLTGMLKGSAQIAYLANPLHDRTTVLDAILACYGIEPAASPLASQRLLLHYLLKTEGAGKTCVAIFDEAQDLDRDRLEDIRLLSNFETQTGKLLQIVLAGQPRIAETLSRPDCEQIRQRCGAVSSLVPLSRAEARDYLAHRLQTAGGKLAVFAPAAVDAVISAAAGVPRNMNMICWNALNLAYALGSSQVTAENVAEACRDLDSPRDCPKTTPAVRRSAWSRLIFPWWFPRARVSS